MAIPAPTDTLHSIGIAEMIAMLQTPSVAAAAQVDATAWGSTVSPRVVQGNRKGFIFGLHRGRLPMIEIWHVSDAGDNSSWESAWITANWAIRVHVGGVLQYNADTLAHAIMYAALASIRNNLRQKWGHEQIQGLVPGTLGHKLEATFTVINTMSRSTFTVVPGFLLAEDGSHILAEDGSKMIQENALNPTVLTP